MTGREALAGVQRLAVHQPEKMKDLLALLEILEGVTEQVKGVQPAGGGTAAAGDDGAAQASVRASAIAHLPDTAVMQEKLVSALETEVRRLQQRSRVLARRLQRGSAYTLNEVYARIRKIRALILEILSAAREVIERLYVRLFIDGQPIV